MFKTKSKFFFLLKIEHIETNQIVRAGDLQCSHNIHYTLCVQCDMSGVRYQVSHVTCHVSGVRCHVSYFMCHFLCVICKIFFTKWLSWLVEALLSTGPTHLVFRFFFLLKMLLYPIFTYLGLSWSALGH